MRINTVHNQPTHCVSIQYHPLWNTRVATRSSMAIKNHQIVLIGCWGPVSPSHGRQINYVNLQLGQNFIVLAALEQNVAKHNKIMLTRIRLPAILFCHVTSHCDWYPANIWIVSKVFCLSSSMKLGTGLNFMALLTAEFYAYLTYWKYGLHMYCK